LPAHARTTEAAEAIAVMEADRDAICEARATFALEIAGLKHSVTNATRRLAELERGRRIAQTAEAVRPLRSMRATPPNRR